MKASTDHAAINAVAQEVFQRPRYARRPGPSRIRRLLGSTARGFDTIHVVGSNGKGSVSVMTAEILRSLGLRVGLFTSPHLYSFAERFWVDGEDVGADELAAAMGRLRPLLKQEPEEDQATAFDVMTALAVEIFQQHDVDVALMEAGIGGRYDSTRVLEGAVSALVSVDLEHTALLGESLEAIAVDKSRIAAPGSTLILGEVATEVSTAVARTCVRRGVQLVMLGDALRWRSLSSGRLSLDLNAVQGTLRGIEMRLGMWGEHQHHNAALAVSVAERELRRRRGFPVETEEWIRGLREGLGRARRPGRMERLSGNPEVWLDVAHTPAALRAVVNTARSMDRGPWTVIFGLSMDKAERAMEMVVCLPPLAGEVICTRALHRGGDTRPVAEALRSLGQRFEIQDGLADALDRARQQDRPVLITGGLFLVAEAATILAGGDPRDLLLY